MWTYSLQQKGWNEIFHVNVNKAKPGIAISVSAKIEFKTKTVTGNNFSGFENEEKNSLAKEHEWHLEAVKGEEMDSFLELPERNDTLLTQFYSSETHVRIVG